MTGSEIPGRLEAVNDRIAEACVRAGRDRSEVTLIAVTKRIPLQGVVAAVRAGQVDLGENRIQEALPRQSELAQLLRVGGPAGAKVRWHFIGHLQRNKAGKAVGRFSLIHAVDSLRLARTLQLRAAGESVRQPVLIEVNLTGEAQKYGIEAVGAVDLAEQVAAQPDLELAGLMAMARFGATEAEARGTFADLRRIRDLSRARTGLPLPVLSMGMSADFEAAVLEGATHVRVGTAIFGSRPTA
jgi:pyridoxal phosphate enzyme (YggS family)